MTTATKSAPRSFSEKLKIRASGRAAKSASAMVSDCRAASELPGRSTGPAPPTGTSRVFASARIEIFFPADEITSLATIPLVCGTTPVKSALCPGAVSVMA
jgi:hypothetical protein